MSGHAMNGWNEAIRDIVEEGIELAVTWARMCLAVVFDGEELDWHRGYADAVLCAVGEAL